MVGRVRLNQISTNIFISTTTSALRGRLCRRRRVGDVGIGVDVDVDVDVQVDVVVGAGVIGSAKMRLAGAILAQTIFAHIA